MSSGQRCIVTPRLTITIRPRRRRLCAHLEVEGDGEGDPQLVVAGVALAHGGAAVVLDVPAPPQNQLSRRGRSLPANASGLDTHRDSL
jgi:hypothetical protein